MTRHSQGYTLVGAKLEHVLVAELALGKSLPAKAEVHHVNGVRTDNRNSNLVICPDRAYHMLLHLRTRALDACGDPNKRRCVYCKEWDLPRNMAMRDKGKKGVHWRHRACHASAMRQMNRKKSNHFSLSWAGIR